MRKAYIGQLALVCMCLVGCGPTASAPTGNNSTSHVQSAAPSDSSVKATQPPDHIVIVVEENHSYGEIAGNPNAPYINSLMRQGVALTDYHGAEHPSQPNYLDLFSGENQGVTSDRCPHTFSSPNLASELVNAGLSFAGYSEDLPSTGYTGCSNAVATHKPATYARKHSPWVNFTNVPPSDNLPFSGFPSDFAKLPTVAFVIPNLQHDMHDGSIAAGDTWLHQHLQSYVRWAKSHNSLLIVTWDEDDRSAANHIPTLFVGAKVQPGTYGERANHFDLLRTIEDMYNLPHLGKSQSAAGIRNIWG